MSTPIKPTVSTVAQDYLKKPAGVRNLILWPAINTLKWAEWARGISEPMQGLKFQLIQGTRVLEFPNFPRKIHRLSSAVTKFNGSLSSGNPFFVAKKTAWIGVHAASLLSLGATALKIVHEEGWFVFNPKQVFVIGTLGFLGSCALLIDSVVRVKKQVVKILATEAGSPQFNLALIRLTLHTLLVAIATFGIIGFTLGSGLIAPWFMLSVGTAFPVVSTLSHFYNELHVKNLEQKA